MNKKMIIPKEDVNQLQITCYNLKEAISSFKGFKAYECFDQDISRVNMLISKKRLKMGELDSIISDLLYNSLLLSKECNTEEEKNNLKELHTHIMVLDTINNKFEKRNQRLIDYTCYWSPKSEHKYCQHNHCIFDEEWQKKDAEKNLLQRRRRIS